MQWSVGGSVEDDLVMEAAISTEDSKYFISERKNYVRGLSEQLLKLRVTKDTAF